MPRYEIEFYARVTTTVEAEDASAAFKMAMEAQQVAVLSPCPRTVPMPGGLPDALVRLSTCTPRVLRQEEADKANAIWDPGAQVVS